MVGNAVPPETPQSASPLRPFKGVGLILGIMFLIGIAMGACSLGMALPVALLKLATG